MKRQVLTFACIALIHAACGEDKEKAPQLDKQSGRSENAGTLPNTQSTTPPPTPTTPTEENVPLKAASLAGYPKDLSAEPIYKITVSEVQEYKWKAGVLSQTSCTDPAGYSPYQNASNVLNLDISFLSSSNTSIKLCVVGRNSKGMEQEVPTEVSWQWTPAVPAAFEQLDFIDGDNQVKIIPKATNIQWLVVRSKDANLNKTPTDGTTYALNERFGTGTVIASGVPAELVDTLPKNLETYTYTVFSVNTAKRYATPFRKTLTLAAPNAFWVARDFVQPGYAGVVAIPNSNRIVCRAQHLANGRDYGWHPGRTQVLKNGDVKTTLCVYEYFSRTYTTNAFQALMVNKGDPMRFFRWVRSSGGTVDGVAKTIIPGGIVDGGMELTADGKTIQMTVCRGYSDVNGTNLDIVGKAAENLAGCIGMINSDDTTTRLRGTLDILVNIPQS